jgi:lipid-binding SYLF domain-containing protein
MTMLRTTLLALAALLAAATSPARAEDGLVNIQFFKAGWVIGGSYGKGVLSFRGEQYLLEVGGLSYGFTFGGSQTSLAGRVRNIRRVEDVNGVYGAGSAGGAIIKGGQVVVLTNQNGAILELSGTQTGLIVNFDLSGLALTVK